MKKCIFIIGIGVLLLCTTGCKNPFADNEIKGDNRTISGRVRLLDGENPYPAYVWLESIDIGTFVDEKGGFSLTLPREVAGQGLSGVHTLYSYVANYKLRTAKVAVNKGEFVYSQENINKEGKLNAVQTLSRALNIETSASGAYRGMSFLLGVEVKLSAVGENVFVQLPNADNRLLGAVFVRNTATGEVKKWINYGAGFGGIYQAEINNEGRSWSIIINLDDLKLDYGQYEVIPHVVPKFAAVPGGLFNSMGINPTNTVVGFLKLPIRLKAGYFTLEPPPPPH